MSTLHLTLPPSLHEQAQAYASKEGISINEFIMLAVAEKLATRPEQPTTRLSKPSIKGREKLLAVLAKAPDVEPEDYDKL